MIAPPVTVGSGLPRIASMTSFYDIDRANAALPEVREVLELLRSQRTELVRRRDELRFAEADPAAVEDRRLAAARIQAIIDQMQASVERLDAQGILLRDIQSGLIDFPALASGRQICLCWRLGEDRVEWWHELSSGYAGRRRLADLA